MNFKPRFSQYNEQSILIEWPAIIDKSILKSILNFKKSIAEKYVKQKVELITAYNSILIIYDFTIDNINDVFLELKTLLKHQDNCLKSKYRTWEIPVCYDDEFGIDLDYLSKVKQLSKSEIITLHSSVVYTVFFIGFLPGFLYLGGLNSKLYLDRKSTPNLSVEKGSVAIGGQQTGIYPQQSPGGWHIIGKTPIDFFNVNHKPPCFIKAGDFVKFQPISKNEFQMIEAQVKANNYQLQFKEADA